MSKQRRGITEFMVRERGRTMKASTIVLVVIAATFSLAASPVMAQSGGGLGIPLEPLTPKQQQLPFTPSESTIQTLQTDQDIQAFADRITMAVSGNTVMLKTISNTVEACLTKLLTADKVGIAACADFVENQNKAFSIFLKDNENLTSIILYGG